MEVLLCAQNCVAYKFERVLFRTPLRIASVNLLILLAILHHNIKQIKSMDFMLATVARKQNSLKIPQTVRATNWVSFQSIELPHRL